MSQGELDGSPTMILQYAQHGSARQYLDEHPHPLNFLGVVSDLTSADLI